MSVASDAPARATERKLTPNILVVLAGLAALGALSTNIILPSFPSMSAALQVQPRELGVTLSAFFIAFALGQLVVGPLSDRIGRRPLVLAGLLLFGAGTILCGTAATLDVMIAGRVVQALGVCAASVLSRAVARDLFDGEALARALALTMVAMAAAPGFSPLLGSMIDQVFGWRATFAFVGAAAVALAFGYAVTLGETHPEDRRAAHSVGAICRAYIALARESRFILPASAVSLVIGGLYAFFAAAPLILLTGFGLTAIQLGLFFAATVFVVFGAGVAAPRLAHRWGALRTALLGTFVALLGGGLLVVTSPAPELWTFSSATVLFLLGMGTLNPLGTALSLQPFAERAGLASALLGFLQMTCAALGAALATDLRADPVAALGLTLSGGALLAFSLLLVRSRRSARP